MMPETIDEAEQALLAAGLGLYQRGSIVMRPAMVPVAISGGRQIDTRRVSSMSGRVAAEAFTKAASWERSDMRAQDWIPTACSQRLAEAYLAREGQWRLPVLTGSINAPTLREDGSILDQPGHDAQTGLLFDPQGERFPLLPREPDRDGALRRWPSCET